MELLVSLVLELAASSIWDAFRSRLRRPEPTWSEKAAIALVPRLGRSLSLTERSALSRWMSRPDVFVVLASSTEQTVRADVERVVAALEYELGPPSDEVRELAAQVAAVVFVYVAELVDPSIAATLSTYRAIKSDLDDLKLGQAVIVERIDKLSDRFGELPLSAELSQLRDERLGRLPVNVAPAIIAAHQSDGVGTNLLDWLGDPIAVSRRIEVLVETPPSWLLSGPAWAAVAFAADAHGLTREATVAFQRASEHLPARRAEFLARAALAASRANDESAAADLLTRARIGASPAESAFLDVVEAAIDEDAAELERSARRALEGDVPDASLVRHWLAQNLLQRDDLDAAIDVFEGGLERASAHAGYLLSYANALMARASSRPNSRGRDAERACHAAISARDLRRSWGGISAPAVATACQAAFVLERYVDVVALGTVEDGGLATEQEAGDGEVRQLVAQARMVLGDDLPEPQSPFEQAWFRGLALSRDEANRAEAVECFEEAVQHATSDAELDRAQRGLALLGHTPIARLDEVRGRNPDHAEILLALAETNAGDHDSAAQRLRPLAGRDPLAALHLATAERRAGRPTAATTVLVDAGKRFANPRLLIEAARHHLFSQELDDADACVKLALSYAAPESEARREARWIEIQVASERRDAARLEAAARDTLSDGFDHPAVRWVLAEALAKLHRPHDAWAEIRREPALTPATDDQARFYMQVLMRSEPSRLDLLVAVLDQFPDSHDVHATGVSMFLTVEFAEALDPTYVAAMQGHLARYTELYPDSAVLRAVPVNTDDPLILREQLRQVLAPDPVREAGHRQIAEQAMVGRLPVGFLASIAGRRCSEIMLNGTTIGFVSIPADEAALQHEIDLATQNLDTSVIIDFSALTTMSFCPAVWPKLLAAFTSTSIPEPILLGIATEVTRKQPHGSFQWDHERDTWTLTEVPAEHHEAVRAQLQRVHDWAQQLATVPAGDPQTLLGLDPAAFDNDWATALATAATRSCALLSDDVGLNNLARSVGVPAFTTFALAVALARARRVPAEDLDQLVLSLFSAQAHDLPLAPAQLVGLAESLSWPLGPSLHHFTRPQYWRAPDAYEYLAITVDGLGGTGEIAAHALYAAIVGLARAVAVGLNAALVGELFAALAARIEATARDAVLLLEAARAACRRFDVDDPLSACVRSALAVERGSGATTAAAAQTVVTLFSGLSPDDRETVTATIVDPNEQ